jgi:XRE family aerobic/anaerobic benzoate catabolism transcriptional regulator
MRAESKPRDGVAFLERLGERVRNARGRHGMSRKLLSRESGISERYLAQLESGRGNISVLLLRQVARAIGAPLEELVAGDRSWSAETALIGEILRRASPADRERAKQVLTRLLRNTEAPPRQQRIALIGLRGAGKSTLGPLIAAQFGFPFIEFNTQIEEISGLRVGELFSLYGPDGYRRFEERGLRAIIDTYDRVVVATGGGIVANPASYDLLLTAFRTVWLRAEPEEHMARVLAQGDNRPMADNGAAMEELKIILKSREPLYDRADISLDTAGRAVGDCLSEVVDGLRREGIKSPGGYTQTEDQ